MSDWPAWIICVDRADTKIGFVLNASARSRHSFGDDYEQGIITNNPKEKVALELSTCHDIELESY